MLGIGCKRPYFRKIDSILEAFEGLNDLMDGVVVVVMQIWLIDPSIRHDGSARTQFRLGYQPIRLI